MRARRACDPLLGWRALPRPFDDYLVVTRAAGVRDLGAPVGNTVFRAGAWIAVGRARADKLASQAFPAMELGHWLT